MHVHQPLLDGRAKSAARYPEGLCRAICRGLVKEHMQQTMHLRAVMGVGEGVHRIKVDPEEFHERDECEVSQWLLCKLSEGKKSGRTISEAPARDDLTAMSLDAGKVREARRKEVGFIRDKKVYNNIPIIHATRSGWDIIRTGWIDINKGDDVTPNYGSRLVAK